MIRREVVRWLAATLRGEESGQPPPLTDRERAEVVEALGRALESARQLPVARFVESAR